MAGKWYFTKKELCNSPSARVGISAKQEQDYKRQAACLINDMSQQLKVSQSCINTATIYMHRFYAYHPQSKFKKCSVACATLFLAAKVKETPLSSKCMIETMYLCLDKNSKEINIRSENFKAKVNELLLDELILLKTLGFVTEIEHPHAYVIEFCQKLNVNKEFSRLADKIATHCLQLTSMCLRYKPKDIAIFCIHLMIKWSHFKIQAVVDRTSWLQRLNSKVTDQLLWKMEKEFKSILDIYSSRIQTRVMDLFKRNFVPPALTQNKTPDRLFEDKNSVRKSIISFHDYLVRIKNQKLENNNNNNQASGISLDISVRPVLISNEAVTTNVKHSLFQTHSTIIRNSRKRKKKNINNPTRQSKYLP
ncbi:cyclin-T1-like [Cotesia typhae]|uniref:cyclin-T1-like n=1 Tax=Cotesia typhae TaxID=2053667 RepID=UPI003D6996EA